MKQIFKLFFIFLFFSSFLRSNAEPWLKSITAYNVDAENNRVPFYEVLYLVNEYNLPLYEIESSVLPSGGVELISVTDYSYEKDRLVQKICRAADQNKNVNISYYYNDDGLLFREFNTQDESDEAWYSTFYNYQNNLLIEKTNFLSTETYLYDENNNLKSKKEVNTFESDEPVVSEWNFEYECFNELWLLKKSILKQKGETKYYVYAYVDGKIESVSEYICNPTVVKKDSSEYLEETAEVENLIKLKTTSYMYDENNLLSKKIVEEKESENQDKIVEYVYSYSE